MDKPQRNSILEKIRDARERMMVANLSTFLDGSPQDQFDTAFDEFAFPKRRHLAKMSDEELAELMATEASGSYLYHLAASVLRSRESWRTPARVAIILSAVSIIISAIALWQSLNSDG